MPSVAIDAQQGFGHGTSVVGSRYDSAPRMQARPRSPSCAISRREARMREETAIEIVLLRHGEPDWTPEGGLSVLDAALTARGRMQAEAAAQALAPLGVDAIYVSSAAPRAGDGGAVAKATGLEPSRSRASPRSTFPSKVSRRPTSMRSSGARRSAASREHWSGWPGGESFRDFHARVTERDRGAAAAHTASVARARTSSGLELPRADGSASRSSRTAAPTPSRSRTCSTSRACPGSGTASRWSWPPTRWCSRAPVGMTGFVWSLQNFNEIDHLRAAGLR